MSFTRISHAAFWTVGFCLFSTFAESASTIPTSRGTVEAETIYLSGHGSADTVEWDFFCSEGRRSGEWTKIRVPSCWEQEGFGTYNYGIRYYGKANPPGIAREQGIYRTRFLAKPEWQGRRVRIVFEASMTDTKVRVNGISAGPVHQGGFYRFSFDITELLKLGAQNELEVTVDKESANESVNLAERRADYWNFGGIFRPVFLQVFPTEFIDRVAIHANADGQFSLDAYLNESAAQDSRCVAQLFTPDGKPVGPSFSTDVVKGGDHAHLATRVERPLLWTAETPALYRVRLSLEEIGAERHVVNETFGFRTFEVRAGDGLYLNGQRILLKGVNRHSFWPETGRTLSPERNYDDVRLIKELNMNAVRMSHYPPDPEFLRACDELGLYVLDELGGWHGVYDSGVGRRLVSEMVIRDVNHPSILFWDNGNEGGWNTELDGEFAKWDPQNRPVLHPQKKLSGVETMHYRSYGETQEYLRGADIFMPTEFLHGLYDGGHGAGLWDYWEMMRQHPRSGGGFLWCFADEGVARSDQNGRIDNQGNYAPDGIVGPHHEREGSFNTVREIWSPVQLGPESLPANFVGVFRVENRYDFTNLDQCTFSWTLARFPRPEDGKSGRETVASGEIRGSSVAPHAAGELKIPLPANWRQSEALYVTVRDPHGKDLWTFSWNWTPEKSVSTQEKSGPTPSPAVVAAKLREESAQWIVTAGALELRFDKETGELAGVSQDGHGLSFGKGPRFVAARRGDRTLDGTINPEAAKGLDRVYQEIPDTRKLMRLSAHADGADAVVEANYFGSLRSVTWRIHPDGAVQLDYEYEYDGVVELMGVGFSYPETSMHSIRWFGRGPSRVWQNRLQGTTWDVWENNYNDTVPGESFTYPEFKGYFRDWRWSRFTTSEGDITVENRAPGGYLGVYTPRDGRDALLFTLPQTGIAFLDVIPAIRNKVNATDLIGPSSQAQHVAGVRHGRVQFRFNPR